MALLSGKMNRRSLASRLARVRAAVLGLAVLGAAMAAAAPAQADGFPERPVKLTVAFPPGGATDTIGREVAKGLQSLWGQAVVIDNKPGAGGMLAAADTARAAPDGYTLFLATDGAIVSIPFLHDKVPYNPLTDLKPIALVGGIPLILVANRSLKVNTFAEFVAAAKAKPNGIDYASSGVGASHHLSMELLQRAAGIKLHHIVYKGGAPALHGVLAGEAPVMWVAVSTALPHIQSGKLVPLATGSLGRSPLLPHVPTVAELGYPGFEAGNWVGIMGPAGLPAALTQKIEADLQKVVGTPAYREHLVAQGNEVRSSSSEEFAARVRSEYMRNKAFFPSAGIAKE
jgi:tripartite-type tricarboxylate transporter receptor subunit TctC